MVKIKIFICTIWIAAFCVTIGGCKSYRQSRKQNQKLYNAMQKQMKLKQPKKQLMMVPI